MYGGGAVRTGCGKENEKKVSSVDLEMWHAVETITEQSVTAVCLNNASHLI